MIREFEPDPEVLADMRLRDSSERDPTRTRGAGVYDWKPAILVEQWPCRSGSCGNTVGATLDDLQRRDQMNRELYRRGQSDIAKDKSMFCESCRASARKGQSERNRRACDEMAVLIRQLKEQRTGPEAGITERELVKRLESMGHPDVQGLVDAIKNKSAARKSRSGSLE